MALGNNAIRACLVLIVACVAHASPPQPSSTPSAGGGSGKFDITKLGARGDGKTDSTKAFMEAWTSACAATGKQEVVVPKGDFLVGPLTLEGPCKGKVRIHLDGNLLGTNDLSQYKKNWIEIIRVDGLAISGHGTLDGQGAGVWHNNQCHKSYNCRTLPNTLVLDFVTNSTIRYITLLNSKFFHMNMFGCEHVLVESVAIRAPGDSPNTDGIHIGDSSDITIKKASIGTGDDCISIGPGSVRITVDGVHCGPGHGISVGSLGRYKDEKDVRDITVKDCVLKGTTNGLRIKSYEDSPSAITASKFTYSGITMDNVAFPIIIDQKYCPNNICTKSGASKVTISDVVFKNIKGTSSTPAAVSLVCTSVLPCKGVRLENVDLKYTGTDNKTMAVCSNAHGTATGVPQELACL